MSTHTVLNDWLLGGQKPSSVDPDTVLGCVRWGKTLGLPNGELDKAFFIYCFNWDRASALNNTIGEPLRAKHVVSAWEGPHDVDYFRVSFVTDARKPARWDSQDKDERRHLNYLAVSVHAGVIWKNNSYTGSGGKVFVPSELTFDQTGKPLRLPDIQVIHQPLSAHS